MEEKKKVLVKSLTGAMEGCFKELEKKNALCEEYLDHLIRLKAEFENYKKRTEKERGEYIRYSNADIVLQLLPIIEHFQRGLGVAKDAAKPREILRGMEMIFAELKGVLEKNGLAGIETSGKPLDPHLHEVIGYVESPDSPDATVIEEVQKGYMLHERVLRPAKVKIAQKPTGKKK